MARAIAIIVASRILNWSISLTVATPTPKMSLYSKEAVDGQSFLGDNLFESFNLLKNRLAQPLNLRCEE